MARCFCVGRDSRAFGNHWVGGSLEGPMRAPLQVLAALLCSAYRAFSCSLHFLGTQPPYATKVLAH